jgi:hypothetical protein
MCRNWLMKSILPFRLKQPKIDLALFINYNAEE